MNVTTSFAGNLPSSDRLKALTDPLLAKLVRPMSAAETLALEEQCGQPGAGLPGASSRSFFARGHK